MIDYLIVGQGLAGSLLSHFLIKKGKSVAFVDNSHKGAASAVAAGIINPITGRHFVKSWKTDEIQLPAFETYRELEAILGIQIFYPKNVAILFHDAETSNNWLARSADPGLEDYVAAEFDLEHYRKVFGDSVCSGVEFMQSGRCDQPALIKAWKNYVISLGCPYLEEAFEFDKLEIGQELHYKGLRARKIIFCEGQRAAQNPYFSHLHYLPAKGEILLVKIPNYPFKDKMAKDGIFIVPLQDDVYWVGSTYNREFQHEEPTQEAYEELHAELSAMLKMPFEVLKHTAGIRPTVRDRKPYLGVHPQHENLYIFNGLGAKGSSLGPYFAAHFADWLEGACELDKEVNINRLKPLKKP